MVVKSIWIRALLVAAVLLGAGEGVTRAFLTSPSGQGFDPELGWGWVPGTVIANYKEGGAPFVVNELGANDDPVSPKQGKLRILGLGNSFMEALQLPRSQNYTSRLEALAPGVDFVNLARSAMGPAHYPVVLRRHVDALDPDLVVVGLGEGDLFSFGGGVELVKEGGRVVDVKLRAESKDQLKESFRPLLAHSALATHLMRRLKPLVAGLLADDPGPAPVGPRDLRPAFEAMRIVMRQVVAVGRPVVVLFVPGMDYLASGETRINDAAADALVRAAVREVELETGKPIPWLDAGGALADLYRRTGKPGHGFHNLRVGTGHLNAAGHDAVARVLVDWLERRSQ